MTIAKASALTLGFLGTFALGVAVGPAVMDRMDRDQVVTAPPVAETSPPMAPEPSRRAKAAVRAKTASSPATTAARAQTGSEVELARASSMVPVSQPELHARLKPVLNRGAKMSLASEGFRDAEQFAVVAHAARNTEIPFMVLKHRVLNEGQSLENAIRASKPDLDAKAEVRRARAEARADLASLGN